MAEIPNYNSPTHAAPRISLSTFTSRLKSKNSPAVPEAKIVYDYLVAHNIDVSFALAHFRVESQYGTAGYGVVTKSWGNSLWDAELTPHAVGKYSPGNGYTYAKYNSYEQSIWDYVLILDTYAFDRGLSTIYQSASEWIGPNKTEAAHQSYTNVIISDMIAYEFPPGEFYEAGDEMVYAGKAIVGSTIMQRYWVDKGLDLYRGTDGSILKKYAGEAGKALFLGWVNGSKDWGMIRIKTSSADPDGTLVYIKKPDVKKISTVIE